MRASLLCCVAKRKTSTEQRPPWMLFVKKEIDCVGGQVYILLKILCCGERVIIYLKRGEAFKICQKSPTMSLIDKYPNSRFCHHYLVFKKTCFIVFFQSIHTFWAVPFQMSFILLVSLSFFMRFPLSLIVIGSFPHLLHQSWFCILAVVRPEPPLLNGRQMMQLEEPLPHSARDPNLGCCLCGYPPVSQRYAGWWVNCL